MSSLEIVAAVVVGAALLWLVAQPLILPVPAAMAPLDPLDPEETPRGQALLALKEIDFDRATGKLSDADYTLLHARYTAAAIDVLADAATVSPVRRDNATASAARLCTVHGARAEPEAIFCSECGLGLLTEASACVACGATLPSDGRFCPGCGVATNPGA